MMRVFICEDDFMYRDSIKRKIEKWGLETGIFDFEIYSFNSSEDLLDKWFSGFCADILFLDIRIPNEMNGIELARLIRSKNVDVPIVFITNFDEYVYQGYTIDALRYLKKPIIESDLYPCLNIAYHHYTLTHQERAILVLPNESIVLKYASILYIEAQSPNIIIHDVKNQNDLVIRYRLSKIARHLPSDLFVQCHRSYIVNLSHIRVLRKTQILLSNGANLPVSQSNVDDLYRRFRSYHQGDMSIL